MLKINLEYRKGILFVRLKGSLSKLTYNALNNYLIPIIKDYGIKYIVFNLEKLDLIDDYGKYSINMIINETKKNLGKGYICNTKVNFKNNLNILDNELAVFKLVTI